MALTGSITIRADTRISAFVDTRGVTIDGALYLFFGHQDDDAGAIAACDLLIERLQEIRTAALGRLAGAA